MDSKSKEQKMCQIISQLEKYDNKNFYTKLNNICIYYYYALYSSKNIHYYDNSYYKKAKKMLRYK